MKKALVVWLLLGIVLSNIPVNAIAASGQNSYGLHLAQETENGLELALGAPPPVISEQELNGTVYSVVQAAGYLPGGNPGEPSLPEITERLVIPINAKPTLEVVAEASASIKLPSSPMPMPGLTWQPNATGDPVTEQVYQPDSAIYQGDSTYPESLCTIASDQEWREWRLLQISCTPWQYRPDKGDLLYTSKATLKLSFGVTAPPASPMQSLAEDPAAVAITESLLNASDLSRFQQQAHLSALSETPAPLGKLRIMVGNGNGIYVLSYDELISAGFPSSQFVDNATIRLFHYINTPSPYTQVEVPILVEDNDNNNVFSTGDRILFYADERDSPYGTTDSYLLDWGTVNGLRLASRSAAVTAAPERYLTTTVQLRNWDPRFPDPWRSEYTDIAVYEPTYSTVAADGHFFAGIIQAVRAKDMPDREWFAAEFRGANAQTAELTLSLQGITDGLHQVQLEFSAMATGGAFSVYLPMVQKNASTMSSNAITEPAYTSIGTAQWNGKGPYTITLPVTVLDGFHVLRLSLNGQSDGSGGYLAERAYIATPVIRYAAYRTVGDSLVGTGVAGDYTYHFLGLGSDNYWLWDVTDGNAPVALTGATMKEISGVRELSFSDNRMTVGRYAAAGAIGLKRVSAIVPFMPVSLSTSAAYLVVSYQDFVAAGQTLVNYHQQHDGLSGRVVTTQQIYDRYSFGLMDSEAIRRFISEAYGNWLNGSTHILRYLLLLGDGSYDFKNRLNHGEANYLPPYLGEDIDPYWQGQSASDNRFANGNRALPNIAVGRIPVRTINEAVSVVNKIIGYEDSSPSDWSRRTMFAADDADRRDLSNGTTITFDFNEVADEAASATVSTGVVPSYKVTRVYQYNSPTPPPGFYYNDGEIDTAAILANWQIGNLLTYYSGHSYFWGWATPKLFNSSDIENIPQSPLTVLLAMTCFTGVFYHPSAPSLDEALLVAAGRGTVSSFSPLGMGSAAGHRMMQGDLVKTLLNGGTMGDALLAGKIKLTPSYADLLDTYSIIGDPALRLVRSNISSELFLPLVLRLNTSN